MIRIVSTLGSLEFETFLAFVVANENRIGSFIVLQELQVLYTDVATSVSSKMVALD